MQRTRSRSTSRPPGPAVESPPGGYVSAIAVVAGCTLLSFVDRVAFVMALPVGMLAVTARFGVSPAVFTAALGLLVFDFVVIPPTFAFSMPAYREGLGAVVALGLAAVAVGMAERLRRQVSHAKRQAEVEQLRNALLSALSHDLKTPLTALVGAGNALCDPRTNVDERRQLGVMVAEEATRLSRLVENLLELTRLQSGGLASAHEPHPMDEVIGSALRRLEQALAGRAVTTDVPEEVPLVPFDPVLIENVLVNLLENVTRHTPPGTPIDVRVERLDGHIQVAVADRGPGVPRGDEAKVFDKLYRGAGKSRGDGGVGLGLTICRAILVSHDGRIWMENRPGGGAVVRFTLPLESAALRPPLSRHPHAEALPR